MALRLHIGAAMCRALCIALLLLGCSADNEDDSWVPGPTDDPPAGGDLGGGGDQGDMSTTEGCKAGFDDCDRLAENGCEADLSSDGNCGGCGRVCELANAEAMCAGVGRCAVRACDAGFADCDGEAGTGCERDLAAPANGCDTPDGMSRDVSGDLGNDATEAIEGTTSRFARVHVTEDNVWWTDLTATVALDVPDAADYDLIVWDDCGGTELASLQTAGMGQDESACVRWADTYTVSNSRDLLIEVRFRDGASCQPWSLSVLGNSGCM